LKLTSDEPLSIFAFNSNLRRYTLREFTFEPVSTLTQHHSLAQQQPTVDEVEMEGTPLPTIIDIDENEEKKEEEGVRGGA